MPSSRPSAKRKRRSQTTQTAVPKPPDLGGRIMWLPKVNELSTPSGLPYACHDHPVILLSPKPLPNNEVVILMVTSFGGRDLKTRHRHDYERRKRAHYLPIDPSPAHPDDPDKNVVLKLGGGAVLRKKSWVNTETQYRVAFSLLRNYEWRTGKLFVLMPESYGRLRDFVGFRADEVVAGPSGTPEPEAGPAVTQTATPPLTPELTPVVVVPEPVPEPVIRLPEVVESAMAHDSDSDTTIVAEDYWDADMSRRRDQVSNQRFAITRENNHGSNPSVFMGAHRASYATSASEESRQQTYRPVSQQQDNERSSLLRSQTQAATYNPQGLTIPPGTRTGYGTLPSSSSRPPQIHTPSAQGQAHSRILDPFTAAATALARAQVAMLERKRPKHTWFSRLGLPFRFDFVFFGTSSEQARADAREFTHDIAIARVEAGLGLGPDTERMVGGRLVHAGITRAQRRTVELEVNAGPAFEYARIALSTMDEIKGEEGKGRMSMIAKGVIVFVILLAQATLLAAVVWSVVHFEADTAVVEWIARASGKVAGAWEGLVLKVVEAWEVFVYGFWVVVEFVVYGFWVVVNGLIFLLKAALGLYILAWLAYCLGYRGTC